MTFRDYSETPVQITVAKSEPGRRRRAIYRHGAKRCLDIALVVLTLPISLPLILA